MNKALTRGQRYSPIRTATELGFFRLCVAFAFATRIGQIESKLNEHCDENATHALLVPLLPPLVLAPLVSASFPLSSTFSLFSVDLFSPLRFVRCSPSIFASPPRAFHSSSSISVQRGRPYLPLRSFPPIFSGHSSIYK